MPGPGVADLHVHTFFSDSTFSADDVVKLSQIVRLKIVAITDHDTVEGIEPALEAARETAVQVIPGMELSSEFEGDEVHIIGLFVDPTNEILNRQLKGLRDSRRHRIFEIVDRLTHRGIRITPEDVFAQATGSSVGRPHVAHVLKDKGFVGSLSEAFARYLGEDRPAYVEKRRLEAAESISLIAQAGGISVLAHPGTRTAYNHADEPHVRLVKDLKDRGLDAIEAFYPRFSERLSTLYVTLARELDLGISGGSDCHGLAYGEAYLGNVRIPQEFVDDLEERAEASRRLAQAQEVK